MLFAGLLVFIFLIIIRPHELFPYLEGAKIVLYVMSVLIMGWLLSPIPKRLCRTVQDKFVTLFFFSIVVSTLTVKWIAYSANTLIDVIKLTLIYYFITTIVNSETRFKTVTWVLVTLLAAVGGMSVLQYYGIDLTGRGMTWSNAKGVWQMRGVGIFDNPNDIAYSVVFALPFSLGLFIHYKETRIRVVGLILLAISGTCIYLTKSRGGYLAAVASLAAWSYFSARSKAMRRFITSYWRIVFGSCLQRSDWRLQGR